MPIKEIRKVAERVSADDRKVTGYAAVFDSESVDLGGFTEVIDRHAFDGVAEVSDVLCPMNHDVSRGILARSDKGKGSLTLEVDDHGLRYTFEAPHTALGDELLEYLRRGDIKGSSFAFTVAKEDTKEKNAAGQPLRKILKVGRLYDVSPVYNPAYEDTEVVCDRRWLDELRAEEERKKAEGAQSDEERAASEQEEPEKRKVKPNKNMEEEKFSLLRAVRAAAYGQEMPDVARSMSEEGKRSFRASGLETVGQIVMPMELRGTVLQDATSYGTLDVGTEVAPLVEPLRAGSALVAAGATVMQGLVGDVNIPELVAATCAWKGEVAAGATGVNATKGLGGITLTPKRLTCFVDISKQLLLQDTNSIETALRNDISRAVMEKLEGTVLGNAAGSTTQPAGIFNGVSAQTTALDYAQIAKSEESLDTNNIGGEIAYIVAPNSKRELRTTAKGSNTGGFIMEDGEIDGAKVFVSSQCVSKGVAVGRWSDMVIGQWGGIDILVDPYTQAASGLVRLVVNAYLDAGVRRTGAIAKLVLKADA